MRSNTLSFLIACLALSQTISINLQKLDSTVLPSAEQELIEKIKQGIDPEENFELLKKLNDAQEKEIKDSIDPLIQQTSNDAEQKLEQANKEFDATISGTIAEHNDILANTISEYEDKLVDNESQLKKKLVDAEVQAQIETDQDINEIDLKTKDKIKDASNQTIEDVLEIQSIHTQKVSESNQNYVEAAEEIDDKTDDHKSIIDDTFSGKKEELIHVNDKQEEAGKCSLKVLDLKKSIEEKEKVLEDLENKIKNFKKVSSTK